MFLMIKKHFKLIVENYKTAEFVDISIVPSFGFYFTNDFRSVGLRIGWIIWELHFLFDQP